MTNATTVQNHEAGGWPSIDWATATRVVLRLQQRIFRASQQGHWRQVRSLQSCSCGVMPTWSSPSVR